VARNPNKISRGNGTITDKIIRQAKVITKGKSLKKDSSQV
jgi:type III secretion system FlhB-like substrate exporter